MKKQSLLTDFQTAKKSDQQEDPTTIATILNQTFFGENLDFKVGWKDGAIGILVESNNLPEPNELVNKIQQNLNSLRIESTSKVRIYGRQAGTKVPAWRQECQLSNVIESDEQSLSLVDWMSQGQDITRTTASKKTDFVPDELRVLHCQLTQQHQIFISLEEIQSVISLSAKDILAVPDMPDWILGVCHHRGNMLWLSHLNAQLGGVSDLETMLRHDRLVAIAIGQNSFCIGLVVQQAKEIETLKTNEIHAPQPGLFSDAVLPYLVGYVSTTGVPILNIETILQDARSQGHFR